jgi:hypothetical protein
MIQRGREKYMQFNRKAKSIVSNKSHKSKALTYVENKDEGKTIDLPDISCYF